MAGTKERAYASTNVTFALGRQDGQGTARTNKLWKILLDSVDPKTAWDLSEFGYEVGSGSNNEGRSQKEIFKPGVGLNGKVRVGAVMMNLLCAAGYSMVSAGTDPTSAVTTTLSAAVNSRFASTITVADASGLAVGDWVQIGAPATPGSPVVGEKFEVHEITGIATNTLTFGKGKLLYTYANNAPVKKVRKDRKVDQYFFHLQNSDEALGANDLWTIYIKFTNGQQLVELLFIDGKLVNLNPNFQVGNIATFQAEMKHLDAHRDPTVLAGVTLLPDPNPYTVRNSAGTFHVTGNDAGSTFDDDVNAPQQIGMQLVNSMYDDTELGEDRLQSNIITGHSLKFTTGGKFIKGWMDALNFGGAANYVFTDGLAEVTFNYKARSAKVIDATTSTRYSLELNAQDTQLANLDPKISGNQVITGGVEMGKVVTADDGTERWSWHIENLCTTDVVCPA